MCEKANNEFLSKFKNGELSNVDTLVKSSYGKTVPTCEDFRSLNYPVLMALIAAACNITPTL